MKQTLSIILFVCCIQASYGRFSKFAPVIPSTEKQCKLNISVSSMENGLYSIKFPWKKQSKQCWLIVFEDGNKPKENINYRQVIWHRERNVSEGICQIIPLRENQNGNVEVMLTKEVMNRSYISIDFPSPVMDGGYYYTIDLPTYLKSLEK